MYKHIFNKLKIFLLSLLKCGTITAVFSAITEIQLTPR